MYLNPFSSPDYKNPADAGMKYLDQIPDTIKPYYDPYIDSGKDALGTLMGQYQNLLNDPGAMMNKMGQSFQQSPGYQFQVNQAGNAAGNAAAAGGMLGTGAHQYNVANMTNNLANQDYYNYLGHTLGLYNQGLSVAQDINHMGYGASDQLAQSLGANLMNQGNMAYAGAQNQNQANGDRYGRDMSMVGGAMGAASGFF